MKPVAGKDFSFEDIDYPRGIRKTRTTIMTPVGEKYFSAGAGISGVLRFQDFDAGTKKMLKDILGEEIFNIMQWYNVPFEKMLAVGIGNRNSSGDRLGPATTRRLLRIGNEKIETFEPSTYNLRDRKISTADLVKEQVEAVNPSHVFAVDSAVGDKELFNIQFDSSFGISPGGGRTSGRIDKKLLSVPVASVSVPTAYIQNGQKMVPANAGEAINFCSSVISESLVNAVVALGK